MKRRLLLWWVVWLVLIWWAYFLLRTTKTPLPPVDLTIDKPSAQQNDNTNELLTWTATTGDSLTWSINDDTELPLDQQWAGVDELTNTWNQESDPEVDEIINILEELIEESESEK
jgi:hypothetical protein